jgi:hypothetical protein
MDHDAIAKQFLDTYYQTMSSNRMNALAFYNDNSCMSYEGDHYKGLKAIGEKLQSINYGKVRDPITPD